MLTASTKRSEKDYYLKIPKDGWYKALALIESDISITTQSFFAKHKLKALLPPVTTTSISSPFGLGSDSSPVEIQLFGVKAFLADSEQFMLEYGCRVFDAG